MALIIDGYNLLNATGIFAQGGGSRQFERTRFALLNFLADVLPDNQRTTTTIVFDARDAPPGLPSRFTHRDMHVIFARGYAEADQLIEELIRAAPAPRRLTVVSSDHRVQNAARRRRANAVDSDLWYRQARASHGTVPASPEAEEKPPAPLSEAEVNAWLRQFQVIDDMPQNQPGSDAQRRR